MLRRTSQTEDRLLSRASPVYQLRLVPRGWGNKTPVHWEHAPEIGFRSIDGPNIELLMFLQIFYDHLQPRVAGFQRLVPLHCSAGLHNGKLQINVKFDSNPLQRTSRNLRVK